jgi:hypothetical protein
MLIWHALGRSQETAPATVLNMHVICNIPLYSKLGWVFIPLFFGGGAPSMGLVVPFALSPLPGADI